MTDAIIAVIAAAAIGYAAWYETQLGRQERSDRDFARRSRADLTRHDTRAPRFTRDDPSPRRRAS